MAKFCRTRKFHVVFQELRNPTEDFKDIQNLTVDVFADSAEEAIKKSWEAVKLSDDDYEILMVDSYRNYPIAPANRYGE